MHRSLPRTTHTVEMAQLAELDERLAQLPSSEAVTADEVGLTGAQPRQAPQAPPLVGTAVLTDLCWNGSPSFPDIHAHFSFDGPAPATSTVDLHTPALRALSRRLGLRHIWGVTS